MTNTIIELRHSYVTGNVPSSLANGELAINTYDGKLFYRGGASNTIQTIERYEGPSGLDGEVQFNDSGTLGSDSGLTYNKTTDILTVTGAVVSGGINVTPTILSAYSHANAAFEAANTGGGGGGTITLSPTPPSNNAEGDIWIDSDDGTEYTWFNDNTSYQWVELGSSPNGFVDLTGNIVIGTSVSDNISINSTLTGNLLPTLNVTYDLGSPTRRWKDLYLSGSTLNLGGATIKTDGTSGAIALIPAPSAENPNPTALVVSPTGTITTANTDGGAIDSANIANAASNTEGALSNDFAQAAFNTANSAFDHANAAFETANSGGGGSGSTGDVLLNNSIISSNITVDSGKNGLIVGPITMNTNLSITIASGQRLIIL